MTTSSSMRTEGTLVSAEGVRYSMIRNLERDDDHRVTRLEVGIRAILPDGTHHVLMLVPSTATDEGHGTGNVFLYEDDDPLTHIAWSMNDENEED